MDWGYDNNRAIFKNILYRDCLFKSLETKTHENPLPELVIDYFISVISFCKQINTFSLILSLQFDSFKEVISDLTLVKKKLMNKIVDIKFILFWTLKLKVKLNNEK